MPKQTKPQRLHGLDGLRGLAILLVVLNHMSSYFLSKSFPFMQTIGFFSSGVSGVTFLFILSGFLMTYLYPTPTKPFEFIQKRYTRIFPLFLSMCLVMLFLSLLPNISWEIKVSIILLVALCGYGIWQIVKKIHATFLNKTIFYSFLALQIAVGGFYLLWVLRHPPSLLASYPFLLHQTIIGLVNATLTFPLGNYIPMLDGVYWSLAAEVFFYLLYPFVAVPITVFIFRQKNFVKILFLLSLIPFFAGLDMLCQHILFLSTLQPDLFFYFATGITLGVLYRTHAQSFSYFSNKYISFSYFITPLLFIGVFLSENLINNFAFGQTAVWVRLLYAIPFTFFVALLLDTQLPLTKFFTSKWLIFLGTISYSLYLSHSAVIHILGSLYSPTNTLQEFVFDIVILSSCIGLASILYVLLERPYFQNKLSSNKTVEVTQTTHNASIFQAKYILAGACIVYLFAIFLAFQSNYNIFSIVVNHPTNTLISPKNQTKSPFISMQKYPDVLLKFSAKENNLGIVSIPISHTKILNSTISPMLIFDIKENNKPASITTVSYVLDEFRGVSFPFGFPTITDSRNKTYFISLHLTKPTSQDFVTIDTSHIQTIYQTNKRELMQHPQQIVDIILNKLTNVFENTDARLSFFLFIPFIIVVFISLMNSNPLLIKSFPVSTPQQKKKKSR